MASRSCTAKLLSLTKDGSLLLSVSVKPGARSAGVELTPDALEIRVTAQPQDGEANAAVIKVVSKLLGVGKSSIAVARGHTSRQKVLSIDGLTMARAEAALLAAAAAEEGP
jgi:uncharacterized protein